MAEVAETLGIAADSVDIPEGVDRSLYTAFREEISGSFMIWRHHSQQKDVVVMNDYCSSTGKLQPQGFVHVTGESWAEGHLKVSCTCRTYSILQQSVNTEEALDPTLTCMHCRFFLEHLQNVDPSQLGEDIPNYLQCIQDNVDKVGNPVVCLGSSANTTKFSVVGQDGTHTFVHMTIHLKDCWAKCLSGSCQIKYLLNKKKIPKEPIPLYQSDKLCPHLNTVFANIEVVIEDMDFFFGSDVSVVGEEEIDSFVPEKDEPTPNVHFNVQTGLWEGKSLTSQSSTDMFSEKLITKTALRLSHFRQENFSCGMYSAPALAPPPGSCECGGNLEVKHKFRTKVYCREVSDAIDTFVSAQSTHSLSNRYIH